MTFPEPTKPHTWSFLQKSVYLECSYQIFLGLAAILKQKPSIRDLLEIMLTPVDN